MKNHKTVIKSMQIDKEVRNDYPPNLKLGLCMF